MPVNLRATQALYLWHRVNLALCLDDQPDLSQRQWAILLSIYLETPPHSVRGLAAKLNVTKPVITRALNTMGELGLVARRRDDTDKRNVIIQRTVEGALFLEKMADVIVQEARDLTP